MELVNLSEYRCTNGADVALGDFYAQHAPAWHNLSVSAYNNPANFPNCAAPDGKVMTQDLNYYTATSE